MPSSDRTGGQGPGSRQGEIVDVLGVGGEYPDPASARLHANASGRWATLPGIGLAPQKRAPPPAADGRAGRRLKSSAVDDRRPTRER